MNRVQENVWIVAFCGGLIFVVWPGFFLLGAHQDTVSLPLSRWRGEKIQEKNM